MTGTRDRKRHRLSIPMEQALDDLRRARDAEPTTWDGILYGSRSFYDLEVHVAYVNVQTARALLRRGLVEYGERDPDWGIELRLTDAGGAR